VKNRWRRKSGKSGKKRVLRKKKRKSGKRKNGSSVKVVLPYLFILVW
jgi:hypothetical protein